MFKNLCFIVPLFIFYSCTSNKIETHRFSEVQKPDVLAKKDILSFFIHQNFKGDIYENEVKVQNKTIGIGGLELLKRYHQIALETHEQSFFLSLGSEIPLSGSTQTKNIYQSWDRSLMGPETLDQIQRGNKYFILSNLIEIKTAKAYSDNLLPSYAIIKKGNKSISLTGVNSYQTFSEEEKNSIRGVYFQDPYVSLLEFEKNSRFKNTDLRVLMFKGITQCKPTSKKNQTLKCPQKDELLRLAQSLPLVDLIFVSNAPFEKGVIGNTSIIGIHPRPNYITVAHFDLQSKKIVHTKMIELCRNFFKETNDCFIGEETDSIRFEFVHREEEIDIVPAIFWGQKI